MFTIRPGNSSLTGIVLSISYRHVWGKGKKGEQEIKYFSEGDFGLWPKGGITTAGNDKRRQK